MYIVETELHHLSWSSCEVYTNDKKYFPAFNSFGFAVSRTLRNIAPRKTTRTSTLLKQVDNVRKSINVLNYQPYFTGDSLAWSSSRHLTTTDNPKYQPESEHRKDEGVTGLENLAEKSKSSDQNLTHVDSEGKLGMVDISEKSETRRYSVATGTVKLGEKAFGLVKKNKIKKGDVLSVAKLAGIMAAKHTSTLIPLCHGISLTAIKVDLMLEEETFSVGLVARVDCTWKTGVEMEALTAVSVAALTVYDMCKSVSKNIVITDVRLEEKDGGKSGPFIRKTL